MNEAQFIGKVKKIYPMQKSTGGYEYITFLLKVPKITRLDSEYEDDIQYSTIPITAWRKLAQRVERDINVNDIVYVKAHVSVFENQTSKGSTYVNPKIVLDGFTHNYDLRLSQSNKTDELKHHIAMSILTID